MEMKFLQGDEAEQVFRSHLEGEFGVPRNASLPTLTAVLLRQLVATRTPSPGRVLIRAVAAALDIVQGSGAGQRIDIAEEIFDELVNLGELQLSDDVVKQAPRSFCLGGSRHVYLQGGLPDISTFLPDNLAARLMYREALRFLVATDGEDLDDICRSLIDAGYAEIPRSEWLQQPDSQSWSELLRQAEVSLSAAGSSGRLSNLEVIDPSTPGDWYKRRWKAPTSQTGLFVGRRIARYGNRLWYYVELLDGQPVRAVNLPCLDKRFRSSDEALWLQCAIDMARGTPQRFVVARRREHSFLGFFSPLPSWVERRLLLVGEKVPNDHDGKVIGSLFTVEVPVAEEVPLCAFLANSLWLSKVDEAGNSV